MWFVSVSCPRHGIAFRLHSTYGILKNRGSGFPTLICILKQLKRGKKSSISCIIRWFENAIRTPVYKGWDYLWLSTVHLWFLLALQSLIVLALQFGVKELDIKAHLPCNLELIRGLFFYFIFQDYPNEFCK